MTKNDRALWNLAFKLDLTEWHLHGARILERVNGLKNAEGFLRKAAEGPKWWETKEVA